MINFFLLGIFWILTYLFNLSIFPFGGDSSELATSMSTWGLSHPPGYPLQNFLGNIFVKVIPFANIYQKTAFFSSFFILLTAILITSILSLFIKQGRFKILSSIYFFSLFPIWLYGIVPEVFGLALFIITSQIYLLLKFKKTNQYRFFYLFLLFIGLGISHHHIFILFIPGYLYILFKKIKIKINLKILIKSILCGLIGFSFYLYAPIVSFFNTPMDMENAKNINGFIRLLLRSSYGTFTAYTGATPNLANQSVNMFTTLIFLIKDIKPLGLIFIFLGFIYLFKKIRYLFIFFIIDIFCFLYFYFITNFNLLGSFSMGTFERFLVFLYLILVMVFAFGINYAHEILTILSKKLTYKIFIRKLVIIVLYILILTLITSNILINIPIIKSISKNKVFLNYGYNILDSLPLNSYLFLNSDHGIFLVQAAQLINKKRLDVIRIPSLIGRDYVFNKFKKSNPKLLFPSSDNLQKIIEINYPKKNYFFSDKPISDGVWTPNGLTWRYFPNIKEYELHQKEMVKLNIKYWTKSYFLSALSSDEKSLFFLDNIYEIYANQMSYAVDFLLLNGKPNEVENILTRHYLSLKNYYSYQTSYLNYNLREKKCSKNLEEVFNNFSRQQIRKESDRVYIAEFIKLCKKNDPQLLKKYTNK